MQGVGFIHPDGSPAGRRHSLHSLTEFPRSDEKSIVSIKNDVMSRGTVDKGWSGMGLFEMPARVIGVMGRWDVQYMYKWYGKADKPDDWTEGRGPWLQIRILVHSYTRRQSGIRKGFGKQTKGV